MRYVTYFVALVLLSSPVISQINGQVKIAQTNTDKILSEQPIGFASLEGGTQGGLGGRIVSVTSVDSLKDLLDSDEKLVLLLSGNYQLSGMTSCRSDKTILGVAPNTKIIGGGFELYKKHNVIIRNITFEDAQDDALKINQNTHNIWVDHCMFTDGALPDPEAANHDGLLDITRESNYVTISYCVFVNHSKDLLIGMSDGYQQDVGYLKVTLHHNWFNGTRQRHPRVRYGTVHCFNNYYLNNDLYGVASTCEADVVVEGSYFQGVPHPTYCINGYAESPAGDLIEKHNIYDNSGIPEVRGTAFDPSSYYSYSLDSAATVPQIVMLQAGVDKMTSVESNAALLPGQFELQQNYPNPFNPNTLIRFDLATGGNVSLVVYDALGNIVETLIKGEKPAGQHTVLFNAGKYASGVYLYQLQAGNSIQSKKMLLIK